MSFFYSVFGFLIAIAVLVAVHEFGHFWVARKLGVKVLRFSIGFGKPIWKKVAGEDQIEYVVAAIPLGGYVKMLGEGTDEPIDPSERHRAFDNQPIWKRSLIVAAGPGINFLFAIILFMFLGMSAEERVVPVFGEFSANTAVAEAGVKPGERLLAIDQKPVRHLVEYDLYLMNQVLKKQPIDLLLADKNGVQRTVQIETSGIPIYNINPGSLMRQLGFVRILPPSTNQVSVVVEGSPAQKAGLQKDDRFVSIDGNPITKWDDLSAAVVPAVGKTLNFVMERGGKQFTVQIVPEAASVDAKTVGRIGVGRKFLPYPEEQIVRFSRSPLEALSYGAVRTWEMSALTLRMLWKMLTLQVSSKNVSGPITIADVAGQAIQINWQSYINILAVISISLGVMNLLPIPMLDGGHLLTYVVESVAGRRASLKFFEVAQKPGLFLLLCLMCLAFYNDIFRLLN